MSASKIDVFDQSIFYKKILKRKKHHVVNCNILCQLLKKLYKIFFQWL